MKTSSKLLREVYPALLLISLLMSWELTSQGSTSNPAEPSLSPFPSGLGLRQPEPSCKLDPRLRSEVSRACARAPRGQSEAQPAGRSPRFPWEKATELTAPKASAGWESL